MARNRFLIGSCLVTVLAILAPGCLPTPGKRPDTRQERGPLRSPTGEALFEQIDLFNAGDLGVHTFRIPAIVTTNLGSLIAVCDARQDNSGDLPGNIDLVMRRSRDMGRSWEPIKIIQDFPEGQGCGDPSLIVDRWTGRIFCFYAYAPPGIGFRNSRGGSHDREDPGTLHAHTITSDDDGLTWSRAKDLNPQIKDPAWEALFAASGHGVQTSTMRLLQPYAVRDAAGVVSARNAYSDDHGLTWQMGEAAGTDVNESKVVERRDGRIMQNMRHNSLKARFTAVSDDGGIRFGEMHQDPILIDPNVNASLTRYRSATPGDTGDILVFSNPASAAARERMTIRLSFDGGKSWRASRIVHPGPAAYSSITVLPDGTIGLLYERGDRSPYEKITFARFNLDWVAGSPPRDSIPKAGG